VLIRQRASPITRARSPLPHFDAHAMGLPKYKVCHESSSSARIACDIDIDASSRGDRLANARGSSLTDRRFAPLSSQWTLEEEDALRDGVKKYVT